MLRTLCLLLLVTGSLLAQCTITVISGSDQVSASRAVINSNFASLNSCKATVINPTFTGTMTLTGLGTGALKATAGVFGLVTGSASDCVHVDGSSASCSSTASVSSVGMTGDNVIFNSSVTGSPVTAAGTLVPSLKTQTANTFLAGASSGGAATPTFRVIVAGDLPSGPTLCPTCLLGSSLGAGIVHAPGSSQTMTSSPVVSADLNITPTTCTNQLVSAINSGAVGTCHTIVQADLPATTKARGIPFSIGDPGGSALSSASTTTDYITVPFACTISAYNLLIDAGTVTVKFWKIATGTAIPTSGNSINTSGVGISSGTAIHSATLSDFTSTTVTANDILAMNVTAVATAKYVSGVLQCDQ